MANFPTNFSDKPIKLTHGFGKTGDAAVDFLAGRGYFVLAGLTEQFAEAVAQLAKEEHIMEYCPGDSTANRFTTQASTKRWLSAGRAFFILAKTIGDDAWVAVGYGWTGAKTSSEVPSGETTFAVRIGQAGLGQRLSEPFSQLIILGSAKLYEARHFWLETWASNESAAHVYKKIGFELISQKASSRPSIVGGLVEDTRLFMSLPDSYLAPVG